MIRIAVLSILILLTLSACASTGSAPTQGKRKMLSPLQMLIEIRKQGVQTSQFEVTPFVDPNIADFRDQAIAAEQQSKYEQAEQAIDSALKVNAQDPELIQWKAELRLLRKEWKNAESDALRSYSLGPKVGALCRRNWSTVQYARQAQKNATGENEAKQKLSSCTPVPQPRY